VTLNVLDGQGKTVWTQEIIGRKSLNQLRWDLVAERRASPQPYFPAHVTFIEAGTYELRITGDGILLTGELELSSTQKRSHADSGSMVRVPDRLALSGGAQRFR